MIRPTVAEIKRLYVRPSARGTGLGKELVQSGVEEVRQAGPTHLYLDTIPMMADAVALYRRLGVRDIARYDEAHTPPEVWPIAIYMALEL